MEYSKLDNVKTHQMFPTLVHQFELPEVNAHDFYQMKAYINQGKKDVDLYQTADDLHVLSF